MPAQALPADLSADQAYKKAFDFLMATQYAQAEAWFKGFLQQHATHALADNAYYWLGETYLVQDRLDQAAITFGQGLQAFPQGNKAPANLLKLGVALERLGKPDLARSTWQKLVTDFPKAAEADKANEFLKTMANVAPADGAAAAANPQQP